MFSWVNGVPVLGHAKGLFHLACGEREEGEEALYAATRTAAVIGGAALGAAGGPPGMVAGATIAGASTDAAMSCYCREPRGVLARGYDVAQDIENGDNPTGSLLMTVASVGTDAVSGYGVGTIVNSVKSSGKSAAVIAARNLNPSLIHSYGHVGHELIEQLSDGRPTKTPKSKKKNKKSSSNKPDSGSSGPSYGSQVGPSSSGSGSQPPTKPYKNKKSHEVEDSDFLINILMEIFGVDDLDDITICGVRLFDGVQYDGRLNSLLKLLQNLSADGYLERTIKEVQYLFKHLDPNDVSFANFLSLAEFVSAYIGEFVGKKCQYQKGSGMADVFDDDFEDRKSANVDNLVLHPIILYEFKRLCSEVDDYFGSCVHDFRDLLAAIYHYFKHKRVPETVHELTLPGYYGLVFYMLQEVRQLDEYKALINIALNPQQRGRRVLIYDRFIKVFCRNVRVRIVLKINRDGYIVLSTCFIVEDTEKYEEGTEFINFRRCW